MPPPIMPFFLQTQSEMHLSANLIQNAPQQPLGHSFWNVFMRSWGSRLSSNSVSLPPAVAMASPRLDYHPVLWDTTESINKDANNCTRVAENLEIEVYTNEDSQGHSLIIVKSVWHNFPCTSALDSCSETPFSFSLTSDPKSLEMLLPP